MTSIGKNPTSDKTTIFSIVGGASGVGKSTLLEPLENVNRFNTGTLFSSHMSLADRDSVRSGDWSVFEEAVTNDLISLSLKSLSKNTTTILDTHFAAKLRGRNYRIGLEKKHLFRLGKEVLNYFSESNKPLLIYVLLINCNPHDLLERRRLDTKRNRELVPSDCYNGLRENKFLAKDYLTEMLRAKNQFSDLDCDVQYKVIDNDDLKTAKNDIKTILNP